MSGPTLGLGVTASGVETVEKLNAALLELETRLTKLPAAAKSMADLKSLMAGGSVGSGDPLKKLAGEIKAATQQQATALQELAEAIKSGYQKITSQVEKGGKSAKSSVAQARRDLQAEFEKMLASGAIFSQQGLALASKMGLNILPGQKVLLDDAKQTWAGVIEYNKAKGAELAAQAKKSKAEIDAAWAQQQRVRGPSVSQVFDSLDGRQVVDKRVEEARGFAALAKAEGEIRKKARLDSAAAEVEGIRAADLLVKEAEKASSANRKFVRQFDQRQVSGQGAVARIVALAKEEADAEAAARVTREVAGQRAIASILKLAADRRSAEERAIESRMLAGERAIANVLKLARDRAEAEREAQAIETRAMQVRNAAFAAQSPASQARSVLGARTQLDAGLPVERVRSAFGDAALVAAQGTSHRAAYDAVHNSITKVNAKVDESIPRFRSLSRVMQEGHSAARGLASGFGAMYLTWGSMAPLLAGAALSQSFVQSIKIGATVRQELETIRVLSNETAVDVKKLEEQLISLGERGPFGPKEVAEAMKVLSLAGLNAQQVGAALGPSLNLALTGGVSIEKAAESLVAIGTAYGFQAEQFDRVADVVAKAAAVSMSSVSGMMESFRSASVVGQAYKVSITDTATALALLANIGVRNSAAGTSVRQMYSELSGATRKTRDAMKTLNVEIMDQNGAMRPLVEIFKDLDRAFTSYQGKLGKGLSPQGELRAIQEITNQRGAKSTVAAFQALRKQIEGEGGLMSTELERINKEILNSFGFTANAAAEMAATPMNQMKAVVASFQTALYKAFTDIEPTVLKVSASLRAAFTSDEFARGVTGLASTVANFTVALVKHADAVGYLILTYAAYKAAMVGWTLAQVAHNVVQALTTAGAVQQTAATTALVFPTLAATGATTGLTVASGALAVAQRAAAVSARLLLASLGPIGAILGVLGVLWAAYAAKSNTANISEESGAEMRSTLVLDALKAEGERLRLLEIQIGKTKDARQAELEVAVQMARQSRADKLEKEVAPLRAKQQAVDAAVTQNPALAAIADRTRVPKNSQELSFLAQVDAAKAASQQAADRVEAVRRIEAQVDLQKQRNSDSNRRLAEADAKRRAEEEAKRPKGVNPFEKPPKDLTAGQAVSDTVSELAAVVAAYSKHEQTLKAKYEQDRKALEVQNKYKLISHAEYTDSLEVLAKREHDQELANLQKRITDSEPLLAKLRALKDPNPIEKQQAADTAGELEQLRNQLASRQQLAALEKAGRANIIDQTLTLELEKLEDAVDLSLERVAIEERRAGMTAAEAAADVARLATEGSYLQLLRLKNAEIKVAADRLALLDQRYIESGGTEQELLDRLNAVQRLLDQKNLELQRIKDAQQTQGGRAAEGALADPRNMAPWEQMLRNWKNTRGMMLTIENEFKSGFMDAGEKIWTNFLKTGKASMASLKDLVLDTLAKITYRKIIAEPLERVMSSLWQVIEGASAGPAAGGSLGTLLSAVDPAKVANDAALASSTASLSAMTFVGVDPATVALTQVTAAAYSAAKALGTMSVSGGGGGGGGFLGDVLGFLTGGGGEADIGNMGAEALIPGFARGGMFDAAADVMKFAKGASFTNQIFNSPTLFKFARGGVNSLGQMGEAGPEAVMPLTRGSDGRLGVANHGGGQQAPVTNITIIGGPSKPEVSRKKNQTGGEDVLVRFKEGIKAEIAGDVDNGVGLARSISGRFGVNNAAGLVR